MTNMTPKITTFLMFEGNAEEAMNYYTSIFEQSEITNLIRYGPNEHGNEGSVMKASFTLHGQTFMCIDSNIKHNFTFTPSISLFVNCDSEEEIDRVYNKLADGGEPLMAIGSYGFSTKFGWVKDKFGVTWQLNLA